MTDSTIGRRRRPPAAESTRTETRVPLIDPALWWLVAATAALTPIFISLSGHDEFRAPKEYLLRAGGILVIAALVIRWIFFPRDSGRALAVHRTAILLAVAAVLWTGLATIFSTNVSLSVWSLVRVAVCAGFFAGALVAVRRRSFAVVYILLAPALINTALLMLQVTRLWDPIYRDADVRAPSAFVGSSNDVGAQLLAPAIAAAALVFATPRRRRFHLGAALFLFAGILASQSATAIGAYAVALVTIGALLSWRKALALAGATVVVIGIGIAVYSPLRQRVTTVRNAFTSRDYNLLLSYRLTAFMTALQMFRHHPLTGVGPGCYAWNYFEYKIAAEEHHPILRGAGDHRIFMFGTAHSDHLQILAVSGFPGYLLFLGSIVFLGRASLPFATLEDSERRRLVKLCSLPLALGTGTIALAQFPLELAASTVSLLYAAAICLSWNAGDHS
jgi:O-antigen ligase